MERRINRNLKSTTVGYNLYRLLQLFQLPIVPDSQLRIYGELFNTVCVLEHHEHEVAVLLKGVIFFVEVHGAGQSDHKFAHVRE